MSHSRSTVSLDDQTPGRRAETAHGRALIHVLSCDALLSGSARFSLDGVIEVTLGRGASQGTDLRPGEAGNRLTVHLPDAGLSKEHARIARAGDRWTVEDLGSKNGLVVNGVARKVSALRDGDLLQAGASFFLFRETFGADAGRAPVLPSAALASSAPVFRTFNDKLAQLFRTAQAVVRSNASILIEGADGSGRQTLARQLHDGALRTGPWVALTADAVTAHAVEKLVASPEASEGTPLHATRADLEGTLCLLDVDGLSREAQGALLTLLKKREASRTLPDRGAPSDLPLLCTAREDLEALVADGRFHRELYTRLCGLRVRLPALASRREDFGLLLGQLLERRPRTQSLRLTPRLASRLLQYPWPGNLRELDQCLTVMLAGWNDGPLDVDALPPQIAEAAPTAHPARGGAALSPSDAELREALAQQLRVHGNNITAVARAMGKHRTQVRRWLKRFGLAP
jgi:transcriptional regulator with AAA-type ATPase domain